jgi:hypothetical protein
MQDRIDAFPVHGPKTPILATQGRDFGVLRCAAHDDASRRPRITAFVE